MDRRPRVLMLTPWAPLPYDGGSKRIHSLCRFLKDRFRFSLLTFEPERAADPRAVADRLYTEALHIRPVFEEVHAVPRPAGEGPEAVGGLRLPDDVRRFYSAAMARRLMRLAAESDILHVEYDLMAPYARGVAGLPRVFTQHDVGTISFFRSYFREMSGWGKLLRVGDWWRRVAFEREACRWFDRAVVTTEPDARRLARIMEASRIRAVATGVDLEHFQPRPPASGDILAFVGHYPHYPNEDAVVHFCRSILPLVQKKRPRASVLAIGSGPTEAVRRLELCVPGVSVTGTVEDVRPHLARASVFVAPLRLGQGIKGKILEAFAMGIPVVATPRAVDGLEVTPGRDILVAASERGFADAVVRLLESPGLRRGVAERALSAVRRLYGWPRLAARLGDVYEELLGAPVGVS